MDDASAEHGKDTVVHQTPAWGDRANFIIAAEIDTHDLENPHFRWEQLWARQLAADRFEICCIPFFVYDLALGDEVMTYSELDRQFVVKSVAKKSGHYTFRAWFKDPHARDEVHAKMHAIGVLFEWRFPGGNLLAIDAPEPLAQTVADILWAEEQAGRLEYETGRTS